MRPLPYWWNAAGKAGSFFSCHKFDLLCILQKKKNSSDNQVDREQQPVIAISVKEKQKEYYQQQACKVFQVYKDYRDCLDKRAVLGDDYARMSKLLFTIKSLLVRCDGGIADGLYFLCVI